MSAELATLLDRLVLIHQEINNLTVMRTEPPATLVKHDSFPLVYPIFTGYRETQVDYGSAYRVYTFDVVVLVAPANNKPDSNQRAQGIIDIATWVDTIGDHYNQRRRLKPAGYDDLTGLSLNMAFGCEGTLIEPPPNDPKNFYFMTVFNLSIELTIESETNF